MIQALEVSGWAIAAMGASLVLAEVPWFRRTRLIDRLAPYSRRRPSSIGAGPAGSIRQVIAPGIDRWGDRLSAALGVRHDLATRLDRAGLTITPSEFRLRQATRGLIALLIGAATVVALRPAGLLATSALLALPMLVVIGEEHRVSRAVERRRDRISAELPVVAEQLGLLLSAGHSLPSAIGRLAVRSDGAIAADLRQVARRVRQGLSASDALGEWAELSGVDAIDRLVAVLRLHDDAGDLGSLIAQEARTIRAAAHRDLLEVIERRSQLVWVPVTVATLVPGLIFLAVPFMSAMAQVTGGG
jgi:tight adherence protein C